MMKFSSQLIHWYSHNGRDLPWRKILDPYAIWVSEIILQQTRINQGIHYYFNFLARFPTVNHLARAHISDLLHVWQGLGYYNRAINMQKAAAIISKTYDAVFPENYKDWLGLPGVGPYTAAAIVSVAFNHPVAAIDTNSYRVISRIFAVESRSIAQSRKRVQQIADDLLDKAKPGQFNQALIDFGALICRSLNPLCHSCMFMSECKAFQHGDPEKYPLKSKGKKVKKRYFYYFKVIVKDIHGRERFLVYQRKQSDIWKYLYEFPLVETQLECPPEEMTRLPQSPEWLRNLPEVGTWVVSSPIWHKLTHQLIEARLITIKMNCHNNRVDNGHFSWTDSEEFINLPKHRLISKLMGAIATKSLAPR